MKHQRTMSLTKKHVATLLREISDPGGKVFVGRRQATDADYESAVDELLGSRPEGGFWVFGYGSLIWNPAFEIAESKLARAMGWRRTFCLGWDYRFRGSVETPGLMLALDRGGQCRGKVFRIPETSLKTSLDSLMRREMSMIPSAFPARWIKVDTDAGPLRALTFAMDRNSGRYISGLSDDQVAEVLSSACGFKGSMAEYLHSTVEHLESLGIHDRYLWRLQELVAQRIEHRHPMNFGN